MAFLRAFTDDSASERGDQRLFMAGYLNRAEKWALFSEAWDEELRADPSIKYLKMTQTFSGWSADVRDEKLRRLARVIRHFEPLSFEFSISREKFYRIVRPVSPRGLGNPHFTCCFGIVGGVARYIASQGGKIPIEFIFDKQDGVSDDIDMAFDYMKESLPRAARHLIRGKPRFEDDKDLLPLQAADMLAWHLRREHEDHKQIAMTDLLRADRGHLLCGEIDEPMMMSWADHHSQQPGISLLQSKFQWRGFKKEFQRLKDAGIDPSKITGPGIYYPEKSTAVGRAIDRVKRLFRDS